MSSNENNSAAWWRSAVVYQVYVRSFADGNGDGIGDLAGLRSKLDYLADLGVDGIWLNPCYPSPQADHGYDVADYTAIEPDYGDLAAFDVLVADAGKRGMRVLMDLVPNHCSDQHPWFQTALAAAPGSPERARFIFRDGQGAHGELPPNNWQSAFGGPAWSRTTNPDGTPGQWYLHFFDAGQPDFNWRNPEVPALFEKVLRFWFDRGVAGFRIDVAHGLYKHADLPDWAGAHFNEYAWDQPEVHDIYRSWRAIADSYGPDRDITLVGEIWVPTVTALAAYLRADELPQAFFFDLLLQSWNANDFRASIDRAFAEIGSTGATITWTLNNHDVHRTVTRYGITKLADIPAEIDPRVAQARPRGEVDTALGVRRARAAALLLLALPGAQFLYQGEEIGLPEVLDLPDDVRQDPTWQRSGRVDPGRDGCRVPLPWTTEPGSFGFSPNGSTAEPWLPQPDWFAEYAVADQLTEPTSTHAVYQEALHARKQLFDPAADTITWLDVPERTDVLAFRRGDVTCVVVFGSDPFTPPAEWGTVAVASQLPESGQLPGNTAAWIRLP